MRTIFIVALNRGPMGHDKRRSLGETVINTRTNLARRFAGLTAVIAVALSACGGDDDDTADEAPEPAAADAGAEPAEEVPSPSDVGVETTDAGGATGETTPNDSMESEDPIEVKLGNFGIVSSAPGYPIALNEDAFAANGIDLVQNPPVYNAADIVTTLLTGDADIIYTGMTAPVAAVAAGQEVRVIAVTASGFALEIALNNDVLASLEEQGITADSPLADRLGALRGLTLATSAAGSSADVVLRYALEKYGVDPDSDLTIQPAPDVPSIVAAAREGAADGVAGIVGGPASILSNDGGAEVFINLANDDDEIALLPLQVLVTTPDYIADHPDAVCRIVAAFAVGRDALANGLSTEQHDELKELTAPDMDPVLFDNTLADLAVRGGQDFALTQAQLDVAAAVHNMTAISPFEGTLADIADNQFADC